VSTTPVANAKNLQSEKFNVILFGHLWQNLPPVSLTPVVHLDLRISPLIFEKIRNDPNVIIRGLGEDDS
jgi:hypothetical protein